MKGHNKILLLSLTIVLGLMNRIVEAQRDEVVHGNSITYLAPSRGYGVKDQDKGGHEQTGGEKHPQGYAQVPPAPSPQTPQQPPQSGYVQQPPQIPPAPQHPSQSGYAQQPPQVPPAPQHPSQSGYVQQPSHPKNSNSNKKHGGRKDNNDKDDSDESDESEESRERRPFGVKHIQHSPHAGHRKKLKTVLKGKASSSPSVVSPSKYMQHYGVINPPGTILTDLLDKYQCMGQAFGHVNTLSECNNACANEPKTCRGVCLFAKLGLLDNNGGVSLLLLEPFTQRIFTGGIASLRNDFLTSAHTCISNYNYAGTIDTANGCPSYEPIMSCLRNSLEQVCRIQVGAGEGYNPPASSPPQAQQPSNPYANQPAIGQPQPTQQPSNSYAPQPAVGQPQPQQQTNPYANQPAVVQPQPPQQPSNSYANQPTVGQPQPPQQPTNPYANQPAVGQSSNAYATPSQGYSGGTPSQGTNSQGFAAPNLSQQNYANPTVPQTPAIPQGYAGYDPQGFQGYNNAGQGYGMGNPASQGYGQGQPSYANSGAQGYGVPGQDSNIPSPQSYGQQPQAAYNPSSSGTGGGYYQG